MKDVIEFLSNRGKLNRSVFVIKLQAMPILI